MSILAPVRTNWELPSFTDWVKEDYVDKWHSSRTVVDQNLFLDGTWQLDGSQTLDGTRNYGNEVVSPCCCTGLAANPVLGQEHYCSCIGHGYPVGT